MITIKFKLLEELQIYNEVQDNKFKNILNVQTDI